MDHLNSLACAFKLLALVVTPCGVFAQLNGYSVVEVADHDTTGIASLAGMKTYRVYADMTNPDDKVSAVYGDETAPLSLTSSDGFFNSDFGDDLAQNINVLFFSAFPEVEYDSWLTIGYAPGDPILGNVGTSGMTLPLEEFNNGGDLVLDDQFGGSWFVTVDPNATAGDDLQVLIAQLTTSGTFEGSFNIQVFVNGDQTNEQQAEGFLFSNAPDAIFGCTETAACNYDSQATALDPLSCEWPSVGLDCDGNCLDFADANGNGLCDLIEVPGCIYPNACNFDEEANVDDGSCEFFCPGCPDPAACNYDAAAIQNDGSCIYPLDEFGLSYVDCQGNCISDSDGDGICDEAEIPGCQNTYACNFSASATDEDGSCEFISCAGCTYVFACNYDPEATVGNGTCEFGTCAGCTDPNACNFNPTLVDDDGSCIYLNACGECTPEGQNQYLDCNGVCLNDSDADGVCDEEEVVGCTDPLACNYDADATLDSDNSLCVFPASCDTCSGATDGSGVLVEGDQNGNGVCDVEEVWGCTYSLATNYSSVSNLDDGSCVFSFSDTECPTDFDQNGVTGIADLMFVLQHYDVPCGTVYGCTDPTALNFNPDATSEDGSCAN